MSVIYALVAAVVIATPAAYVKTTMTTVGVPADRSPS
jgi:hypothetical protein